MSRVDLYARPHKALRAMMAATLVAIGQADPHDEGEMREAQSKLEELLALCERHMQVENEFIHRAIDAKRQGAACALAAEHAEHAAAIESLRAAGAARAPDLYRRLAGFVAENFQHMEHEEREGHAILHALFGDAELAALEQRIVASVPPAEKMQMLRWMLESMGHGERVALLTDLRHAPGPVFDAALAVARTHLEPVAVDRLEAALELSGRRERSPA